MLKLYEFFENDSTVWFITELCLGGELFDRIIDKSYLSEREAA